MIKVNSLRNLDEFINESNDYIKIMKAKKLDYGDVFKFQGKAHPAHTKDIELSGYITNGEWTGSGDPMIKVVGYGSVIPIEAIKNQVIVKTGKRLKDTQWGPMPIKERYEHENTPRVGVTYLLTKSIVPKSGSFKNLPSDWEVYIYNIKDNDVTLDIDGKTCVVDLKELTDAIN
jgi:hypothetical protein